jgi:KaiC/GvpD/RAD55 family RecA-like ATPase
MTDAGPIERLRAGISGFDQVAIGGLPAGRSTFVGGTTGSGKTLFAVEFLARGISARRVSLDSLSAVFTRFAAGPHVRHEVHRIART